MSDVFQEVTSLCRKGNLSYKPGNRFKNNSSAVPGPGSYSPGMGMSSTLERTKGGKFGIDLKKDMVLRNSVGKYFKHRKIIICYIENPGPGSYKIMRDFGNY